MAELTQVSHSQSMDDAFTLLSKLRDLCSQSTSSSSSSQVVQRVLTLTGAMHDALESGKFTYTDFDAAGNIVEDLYMAWNSFQVIEVMQNIIRVLKSYLIASKDAAPGSSLPREAAFPLFGTTILLPALESGFDPTCTSNALVSWSYFTDCIVSLVTGNAGRMVLESIFDEHLASNVDNTGTGTGSSSNSLSPPTTTFSRLVTLLRMSHCIPSHEAQFNLAFVKLRMLRQAKRSTSASYDPIFRILDSLSTMSYATVSGIASSKDVRGGSRLAIEAVQDAYHQGELVAVTDASSSSSSSSKKKQNRSTETKEIFPPWASVDHSVGGVFTVPVADFYLKPKSSDASSSTSFLDGFTFRAHARHLHVSLAGLSFVLLHPSKSARGTASSSSSSALALGDGVSLSSVARDLGSLTVEEMAWSNIQDIIVDENEKYMIVNNRPSPLFIGSTATSSSKNVSAFRFPSSEAAHQALDVITRLRPTGVDIRMVQLPDPASSSRAGKKPTSSKASSSTTTTLATTSVLVPITAAVDAAAERASVVLKRAATSFMNSMKDLASSSAAAAMVSIKADGLVLSSQKQDDTLTQVAARMRAEGGGPPRCSKSGDLRIGGSAILPSSDVPSMEAMFSGFAANTTTTTTTTSTSSSSSSSNAPLKTKKKADMEVDSTPVGAGAGVTLSTKKRASTTHLPATTVQATSSSSSSASELDFNESDDAPVGKEEIALAAKDAVVSASKTATSSSAPHPRSTRNGRPSAMKNEDHDEDDDEEEEDDDKQSAAATRRSRPASSTKKGTSPTTAPTSSSSSSSSSSATSISAASTKNKKNKKNKKQMVVEDTQDDNTTNNNTSSSFSSSSTTLPKRPGSSVLAAAYKGTLTRRTVSDQNDEFAFVDEDKQAEEERQEEAAEAAPAPAVKSKASVVVGASRATTPSVRKPVNQSSSSSSSPHVNGANSASSIEYRRGKLDLVVGNGSTSTKKTPASSSSSKSRFSNGLSGQDGRNTHVELKNHKSKVAEEEQDENDENEEADEREAASTVGGRHNVRVNLPKQPASTTTTTSSTGASLSARASARRHNSSMDTAAGPASSSSFSSSSSFFAPALVVAHSASLNTSVSEEFKLPDDLRKKVTGGIGGFSSSSSSTSPSSTSFEFPYGNTAADDGDYFGSSRFLDGAVSSSSTSSSVAAGAGADIGGEREDDDDDEEGEYKTPAKALFGAGHRNNRSSSTTIAGPRVATFGSSSFLSSSSSSPSDEEASITTLLEELEAKIVKVLHAAEVNMNTSKRLHLQRLQVSLETGISVGGDTERLDAVSSSLRKRVLDIAERVIRKAKETQHKVAATQEHISKLTAKANSLAFDAEVLANAAAKQQKSTSAAILNAFKREVEIEVLKTEQEVKKVAAAAENTQHKLHGIAEDVSARLNKLM